MTTVYVPLNMIEENPFQKRREYGDIEGLAADIARQRPSRPDTMGLLQVPSGRLVIRGSDGQVIPLDETETKRQLALATEPTRVLNPRRAVTGLKVQLEIGHRRCAAFRFNHLNKVEGFTDGLIPLTIVVADDEQMIDAVFAENAKRKDTTAVEDAELIAAKLARPKLDGGRRTHRDIAEEWGLDRSTVTTRLGLLKLPTAIQDANRKGILSERQVLALGDIAQLGEITNGRMRWSDNSTPGNGYGDPISPTRYVEYILENPQVTSEKIRDYYQRMLNHAGTPLPTGVAKFDITKHTGNVDVQEPLCKGCSLRVNNTCLDKKCLQIKFAAYGRHHSQIAADELGLPFSDDPAHFDTGYDMSETLCKMWGNNERCTHMVIGWSDRGNAVRPFISTQWRSWAENVYEPGSRSGIVLGHKGPLSSMCTNHTKPANTKAPLPPQALIDLWKKEDDRQVKRLKREIVEVLAQAMQETFTEPRVVNGLMEAGNWPGFKGEDDKNDFSLVCQRLAESMWNKNVYGSAFYVFGRAKLILATGNLGFDALQSGNPDIDLRDHAIRVLYCWYDRRSMAMYNSVAKECLPSMKSLHDQFIKNPCDTELAQWVATAVDDIEAHIEKRAEKDGQ